MKYCDYLWRDAANAVGFANACANKAMFAERRRRYATAAVKKIRRIAEKAHIQLNAANRTGSINLVQNAIAHARSCGELTRELVTPEVIDRTYYRWVVKDMGAEVGTPIYLAMFALAAVGAYAEARQLLAQDRNETLRNTV